MIIHSIRKLRSAGLVTALFLGFVFSAFSLNSGYDITPDEVLNHIKYFASDELAGRFPGTPGDSLAEEYAIGLFKSNGLIPIAEDGYKQRFSYVTEIKTGDNNILSVSLERNETNYELGTDFYPVNFSSNGSAEGELVFAGYGINAPDKKYDDFGKINLNGKIAVIMRYTPGYNNPHDDPFGDYEPIRRKCNSVRDAGAKGIIIITGPANGEDEIFTRLRLSKEVESIGIPVIQAKRTIIEKIFEANGKNLEEIQKGIDNSKTPNSFDLGKTEVKIQSDLVYVNSNTANVIGYIEGTDPVLKDEVIVIGAHLDHLGDGMKYGSMNEKREPEIHNGADDNASGSAGVLILADKLSREKQNLSRSYIFMLFSGEEAGLLGSSYFTKSELFKKYNIVAMINMDMIGRLNEDKLMVEGAGTSSVWKTILDSINNANDKLKLTFGESGFGASDHSSFYSMDMPVLQFFTGLHTDYHRPSDDWQTINADGTVKVLNLVYGLVNVIDDRPEKPDLIKAKEEKQQTMRGFKVTLGIIPDYSDAVEGLQIMGVKAGGPGESAGLQKGDIIKKMGSHVIKNIYDYTYALGEYKKGDETELVVKRGEEEIILKVVFGK
jgi:aminopeptidase YwaD